LGFQTFFGLRRLFSVLESPDPKFFSHSQLSEAVKLLDGNKNGVVELSEFMARFEPMLQRQIAAAGDPVQVRQFFCRDLSCDSFAL
jgi:hypothetical protein